MISEKDEALLAKLDTCTIEDAEVILKNLKNRRDESNGAYLAYMIAANFFDGALRKAAEVDWKKGKIQAIKVLRDSYPEHGLMHSKHFVEWLVANGHLSELVECEVNWQDHEFYRQFFGKELTERGSIYLPSKEVKQYQALRRSFEGYRQRQDNNLKLIGILWESLGCKTYTEKICHLYGKGVVPSEIEDLIY